MPSTDVLHADPEEMSPEEEAIAMEELLHLDACRVARELLESGICPFCQNATLQIFPFAGRYAFVCRCRSKTPRP